MLRSLGLSRPGSPERGELLSAALAKVRQALFFFEANLMQKGTTMGIVMNVHGISSMKMFETFDIFHVFFSDVNSMKTP